MGNRQRTYHGHATVFDFGMTEPSDSLCFGKAPRRRFDQTQWVPILDERVQRRTEALQIGLYGWWCGIVVVIVRGGRGDDDEKCVVSTGARKAMTTAEHSARWPCTGQCCYEPWSRKLALSQLAMMTATEQTPRRSQRIVGQAATSSWWSVGKDDD
jgi:hypothetical protein